MGHLEAPPSFSSIPQALAQPVSCPSRLHLHPCRCPTGIGAPQRTRDPKVHPRDATVREGVVAEDRFSPQAARKAEMRHAAEQRAGQRNARFIFLHQSGLPPDTSPRKRDARTGIPVEPSRHDTLRGANLAADEIAQPERRAKEGWKTYAHKTERRPASGSKSSS